MDLDAWMDKVREYEERTFADWMDGCNSDDREEYLEEDAYDE